MSKRRVECAGARTVRCELPSASRSDIGVWAMNSVPASTRLCIIACRSARSTRLSDGASHRRMPGSGGTEVPAVRSVTRQSSRSSPSESTWVHVHGPGQGQG